MPRVLATHSNNLSVSLQQVGGHGGVIGGFLAPRGDRHGNGGAPRSQSARVLLRGEKFQLNFQHMISNAVDTINRHSQGHKNVPSGSSRRDSDDLENQKYTHWVYD